MFDVLTIAAVVDELTATVLDGRVQQVGLLSRRAIGLEIYAGGRVRHLVASAETENPRLLLVEHPSSLDKALVSPLSLLLRKYVRGGTVVAIDQPPLERVVRLSIAKRLRPHNEREEAASPESEFAVEEEDQDGIADATFVHLAIEMMGKHSNLILIDDEGRIMESAKRVTSSMSRVRPIAPKVHYTDPPVAPDRLDPRRLTAEACRLLLEAPRARTPDAPVSSVLVRGLRGVSPQMANEVVFRVTGGTQHLIDDIEPELVTAIAREMRRLLEPMMTGKWDPRVYRDGDGVATAFAPLPLAHLSDTFTEVAAPSMSEAAQQVSDPVDDEHSPTRHLQKRSRLLQSILQLQERVQARLASLQTQLVKASEMEQYRRWGELIYAYLWQIKPGQLELIVESDVIPLDPARSPKETAKGYFEQYRKTQKANERLPEMVGVEERKLAYLIQLETLASQATTYVDLEELTQEWDAFLRSEGQQITVARPRRSAPPKRSQPLLDRDQNAIYVGRSGPENDRITFGLAGPDDTWLHARGVPGSHVIVRWRDPDDPGRERGLGTAAALAAYYSQARGSAAVEVDATERRHVRKIKGGRPGMVTYRNERTMRVIPADEQSLGLTTRRE